MKRMRHVTVDLNQERAATLEAVLFDAPPPEEKPTPLECPRPAVIIAPGGGYAMLSQRKSAPVAAVILRAAARVGCISAVAGETSPAFVWTTGQDEVAPPSQSLRFVSALAEAGGPFEYHHFQWGRHGLSTADELCSADRESLPVNVASWVDLAATWLHKIGEEK